MSHTNDDQRDRLPGHDQPEPVREHGVPADSLPPSDPFVAGEPPPFMPERFERPAGSDALPPESTERSWRSFGAPPEYAPVRLPDAETPDGAAGPPPETGTADTTIGSLGEEPMGGLPREQPDAVPPSPTFDISRHEPRSTLSRAGEELFAWLKTLASAAVYATLIVTFGFQVARVEGQSMAPTLADQDRLIVNKLAYRVGSPQVGDIVMLYYPLNPDKSFVKRVIAEEGDQIRIVDGRVYRNDVPINDDYVPPEFRSHDDYGPEVVPQGYYFVMGDHRNNSSDSRHWKYVPKKYIIGKVQLRWWPIPSARIF